MKSIILQQREERDKLLSIEYQERTSQPFATEILDSKPIKLIVGPRRAGKSVLALQMLKGRNFAYLNFDDSQLLANFKEDVVKQVLSEVYPGYEYLLLDEVQNLDGWSLWVQKLYRRGINLIITGSNANLLSDDFAAHLTGRFVEIRLFPFSAMEHSNYIGASIRMDTPDEIAATNNILDGFMRYGGYPEVTLTPTITQSYLYGLYDTIILKDIVRRYKVRNVVDLSSIADWLLANFTNPFSANSIAADLDMRSITTVQKFLGYLQNCYLFQYLPRFNNKLKLMQKADRKVYVIDNGFVLARAFTLSQNLGRLLENMVFMELQKRGYNLKTHELFYYRTRNDREVDFVCRKGNSMNELIQVCYDMSGRTTRKRELDAIVEAAGELHSKNLTVITWDQEETVVQDGFTINVTPLRKWINFGD